jgi:uncharacterized protein (DUF1501 family)
MDKTRRAILKGMGGLAASMTLPLNFLPRISHAAPIPAQKKLVVIQLKGGNDGANLVIPMDTAQFAHYQSLRPTIGLPLSSIQYFGTTTQPATGVEIDLGLHPAFSSLLPLQNKLAVFPATHSGLASDTSHFFQFDYYDNGYFVQAANISDNAGWLGRYLTDKFGTQSPDGIAAFDFGTPRKLLRGTIPSISLSDPANLDLGAGTAAAGLAIWDDVKAASINSTSGFGGQFSSAQNELFENALQRLDPQNVQYGRVPVTAYPSIIFGPRLKRTVDLLLGLPELELIHLENGGFDTHDLQVTAGSPTTGQQANLLKNLADSLAAFYADLQSVDQNTGSNLLANTLVVVMSEFGRTLDENGNFGTDHGQANAWFVFGEPVIGGIYGGHPGLGPTEVVYSNPFNNTGRKWLKQTVDYRDILTEVLGSHLGWANPGLGFPGYNGTLPVYNFIA